MCARPQGPCCGVWWVLVLRGECGGVVWSGEQGLSEEPPPPSRLFSFLILFTPQNLLDSQRQALPGSWHPGLQAELLRDGLGGRDLMSCGPYPISLHPSQL